MPRSTSFAGRSPIFHSRGLPAICRSKRMPTASDIWKASDERVWISLSQKSTTTRTSRLPQKVAATGGASAPGRLVAVPAVQVGDLRRQGAAEVGHVEDRPDLDLARAEHRIRAALHPLDRLGHVFDLPQPEAGDQLAGLGEGTVDDHAAGAVEGHALALHGRMQTLAGQEDAGVD